MTTAPELREHHHPGVGIASLVLGIMAVILFFIPIVNVVLCALAIIFGAIGLYSALRFRDFDMGLSIAGLALGVFGAIMIILLYAALITIPFTLPTVTGGLILMQSP